MKQVKFIQLSVLLVFMLFSGMVNANESPLVTTQITRVLWDTEFYGSCMARLRINTNTFLEGCPNSGWVSFDCKGVLRDKNDGLMMYDHAKVALALGNTVSIRFTDSMKINGYCVANRIDVLEQ